MGEFAFELLYTEIRHGLHSDPPTYDPVKKGPDRAKVLSRRVQRQVVVPSTLPDGLKRLDGGSSHRVGLGRLANRNDLIRLRMDEQDR